ncbi:hypothetical protein BYT27DRAFT_7261170 [Phlegmacium glaucopus]|nr:hypothetical protein BYT27DRAFT_7261170 [Phlegmacium glaucopus]
MAADAESRTFPQFFNNSLKLACEIRLANIDHGIGEVQHKADGVVGAAAVAPFEAEILKAHYR